MNLTEYQEQTKRTLPDLGSEGTNLAHMVLGIFSEYYELQAASVKNDYVNQAEEVADKFWYISNYCNFRGYELHYLWDIRRDFDVEFSSEVDGYMYFISQLQDYVKKNLVYGKEINREKEENTLKGILYYLSEMSDEISGFDLEKALENNIAKLRVRFPDKFTQDLAINRDVKAERVELER